MSRRRLRWHLSAAFAVAAMMLLCGAAPAYAHEARDVGAYHFLVGWGNEPAYSGQENSVQLVLDLPQRPASPSSISAPRSR